MSVAFDTNVLIWGFRHKGVRRGNPRQENLALMHFRSRILMEMLSENPEQIIVPSIVIGEYLAGVEPANHDKILGEFQSRFVCPPYDLKAAAIASKVWIQHRQLPKVEHVQRSILTADVMLVSTAKAAGCITFHSHDPKCRRLAKLAGLEARDLPDRHPAMNVNAELRKECGLPPE